MEKKDLLEKVEDAAKTLDTHVKRGGAPVFKKYPLTFTLLSLTGFSLVLYGFENIFNKIDFFREHPFVVLFIGLLILLLTGTLYKWLQNREIHL